MDAVKENVQMVGMTQEDAEGRRWKQMICCGNPRQEQPKEDVGEEEAA